MRLAVRFALLALFLICCAMFVPGSNNSPSSGFHLKPVRTVDLNKSKGQVDQFIELPDGSFLLRDSTFNPLELQSVELYDRGGHFVKKIGSFGQEPGHYFALQNVAYSQRSKLIWITDRLGRVSRFDLSGKLVDSVLIQKPGYHPYDLALDEERNRYYLTGCVAIHFYLDLGCKIVHEYELSSNQYIGSFLETDPDAVAKKYFGIENYQIAVAPSGSIYAIDSPMQKFWRISLERHVESFPIASKAVQAIPALDPSKDNSSLGDNNYLFDKIVAEKQTVILAAYKKATDSCLLEVFSADGKPVALDVTAPGRLLGDSSSGTLWFVQRTGGGFRILEDSF
jgi:hypothetical protein